MFLFSNCKKIEMMKNEKNDYNKERKKEQKQKKKKKKKMNARQIQLISFSCGEYYVIWV